MTVAGNVRALIWPRSIREGVGCVGRLGRVLHWIFTAGGLALVVSCLWAAAIEYDHWDRMSALAGAAGGVGVLLLGRALRYVMAAE